MSIAERREIAFDPIDEVTTTLHSLDLPIEAELVDVESRLPNNIYDDHLWVVYNEYLQLPPLEDGSIHSERDQAVQQELVTTEVVLHCIGKGDTQTAIHLLRVECDEKNGRVAPAGITGFNNKLRIFESAVRNGAQDVLQGIGDLRGEAEREGPISLGFYLLEELKLGWNVATNLDALIAIKAHGDGYTLNERAALAKLAIDALIHDDDETLGHVMKAVNFGWLEMGPVSRALIAIHQREIKLKDVAVGGLRASIGKGLKGRKIIRQKQSFAKGTYLHDQKVFNNLVELKAVTNANIEADPVLLMALDDASATAMETQEQGFDQVVDAYNRTGLAVKKYVDHYYPIIANRIAKENIARRITWHKQFIQIDTEPKQGHDTITYPNNILFLAKNRRRVPEYIAELSQLSMVATRESSVLAQDQELATQLLANLEVVKTGLEQARNDRIGTVDLVDKIKHQKAYNQPLANLFEHTKSISSGSTRLTVQLDIYEMQLSHDPDSKDSRAGSMKKKLIETAQACLQSPIDRLLFGEDNIKDVLRELGFIVGRDGSLIEIESTSSDEDVAN